MRLRTFISGWNLTLDDGYLLKVTQLDPTLHFVCGRGVWAHKQKYVVSKMRSGEDILAYL